MDTLIKKLETDMLLAIGMVQVLESRLPKADVADLEKFAGVCRDVIEILSRHLPVEGKMGSELNKRVAELRREAIALNIRSPFRQALYIKARLAGSDKDRALQLATQNKMRR